jgi:hypothetical protein
MTMRPTRSILISGLLLLSACGGGGGNGNGPPDISFVTADPQHLFSGCGAILRLNDGCVNETTGTPGASLAQNSIAASGANAALARQIEEADLYRVDGDLVYVLNSYRGLIVADLARMKLRGRLPFAGWPKEMYVRGSQGLVLLMLDDGSGELLDVDLSNPDAPRLKGTIPFQGWLSASRLVGDVIYAVAGRKVLSFSVADPFAPVDSVDLPFGSGFVYATDQLLAIAGPADDTTAAAVGSPGAIPGAVDDSGTITVAPFGANAGATGAGSAGPGTAPQASDLHTRIILVDISDPAGTIATRGTRLLPGYVADEFKLHIGAGTLRVVTHDSPTSGTPVSHLYVLATNDSDLPMLGSLAIAPGEQLFATRFNDNAAFIITVHSADPLRVIDLRDPRNPQKVGELTVPGWPTRPVLAGHRLVALGVDPADDWKMIVSLFDVADPAKPALLSRVDFGQGGSSVFGDVKAFGVFPDDGLILVPVSGVKNELEVVNFGDTLSLRGAIGTAAPVRRAFPHARGLVVLTSEELILADPSTLAASEANTMTIAEYVLKADRLGDGRIVSLVVRGDRARLKTGADISGFESNTGIDLPLTPDGLFVHGLRAAVTGVEADRRAAYAVDFGTDPPSVSPRIDLGEIYLTTLTSGGVPAPGVVDPGTPLTTAISGPITPAARMSDPAAAAVPVAPGGGSSATGIVRSGPAPAPSLYLGGAQLSPHGKLVVRAIPPPFGPAIDIGTGDLNDGFAVIDLDTAKLNTWIRARGGYATGWVIDGEILALTLAADAGVDARSLPLIRNDLYRIDLSTHGTSKAIPVPGWLVQAADDLVFTIEQQWRADLTLHTRVVASRLGPQAITSVSSLDLPDAAYDLRVAGSTLYFTAGGAIVTPGILVADADRAMPIAISDSTVGTIRLGMQPASGPSIGTAGAFSVLLLPGQDAALVWRDGTAIESWDVTGRTARRNWSDPVSAYPLDARADAASGRYLLALGYAGVMEAPR